MAPVASMRFCMITTFYPPYHLGGDAIFVHRLAHALGDRGHDVDVYYSEDAFRALGKIAPAPGWADHPRVRRHGLRSRLGVVDLLAVHQLGRAVSHHGPLHAALAPGRYDVVHFHNVSLMGAPALLEAATGTDAATLYTLHEHWLVCPMHVLWRMNREPCETRTCVSCQVHGHRPPQLWRHTDARDRGVRAVDIFFAPSRFTLDKQVELGLPVTPRLLPHFVPTPPAPADATQGRPQARPYFLFVGRLERLKGAHTLIDAFRRFDAADLVIAGDGAERESLAAAARDLPHVRLLGRLPPADLGRWYRHARAALVPSLCYEVFGLTTVEAFAHGTPALVRARGALTELVEQSGAGVAYATEDELQSALARLLDDGVRAELSARARAAYEKRWTLDVHLDAYLGHVEAALTNKRGAAAARI
jgi:glycosyltransferase involved in cell wall biosynthesis